ncbi:MAG: signal peptidase I [Bacillota bacterium]|nr:signal peptidase I [Bacillota bacterium]
MSSKVKKELVEWIKSIAFALIVAGLLMLFARPSIVNGESMLPTFQSGDLVLVERITQFFSEPERGDIVVALTDLRTEEGDKKNLIKRVIALPGDSIVIEDFKVYVNGKELQEDYLFENSTGGSFEGIVPAGHVFVLGDNRYNSNDSRSDEVGYIPMDKLKGRVYFRLYPFKSMGLI